MTTRSVMISLACFTLALPVPGAGRLPLDEVLGAVRREGVPWVLLYRPEDGPAYAAQEDDLRFRLENESQLARTALPAQAVQELWQSRGWGGQSHWLLVSARGEEVADGPGLASGARLLEYLRGKGLVPRWETRRAFLQKHPANGNAWKEEINRAFRLARARMEGFLAAGQAVSGTVAIAGGELRSLTLTGSDPEARERQADQVFAELAAALEGARGVEGWWKGMALPSALFVACGASDSPRMRQLCGSLALDLEGTLRENGQDSGLETLWAMYRALAGKPLRQLPDLAPLPGSVWPPMELVSACVDSCTAQKDWEGALGFLDGLPGPDARDPWSAESWKGACLAQSFIAAKRIRPLWELGKAAEARQAVADMRFWAGSEWGEFTRSGLTVGADIYGQKFFQDALLAGPLPDPPMPAPVPPLRLALLGRPPWLADWNRLKSSDALLPWGPDEVQWGGLKEAATGEPRWALLRGDQVLASGSQCPRPAELAAALAQAGESRLQRLGRILEREPDRLDVRRARMELLKARMPEPRLEQQLVEDAQAAFEPAYLGLGPAPLDFGPDAPWKPDPALWQWGAQQALPRIERLLRSWPSHPGLWKAWLAWARFHPARPSVVALAGTLEVWEPRARWIGSLPPEVHRAVAEELRREGNDPELVRWLGHAWAALDKTPAARLDPDFWQSIRKDREAVREAIVVPLARAYRMLKREGEARAVEAAYGAMVTPQAAGARHGSSRSGYVHAPTWEDRGQ